MNRDATAWAPSLPQMGGWSDGDPVGSRCFVDIADVTLDSGQVLPNARLAYESWGTYRGNNAVLVLHALTGDAHLRGPAGPGQPTAGWWEGVVGPGLGIDTDRWFVVAANILGGCQGTVGPSSVAPDGRRYGSRFPALNVRDQVRVEAALADHLGIGALAAVIGGSAGGMRALEWAVMYPQRVERLLVLASTARASAEQIALSSVQQRAITSDPAFAGGDYYETSQSPVAGLDVARQIAHIAYRSEPELEQRFGRRRQPDDDSDFAVASYLRHHGNKLVARFDANSYLVLTRAMDSHDIARDRGSLTDALGQITAKTVIAGIDSDRLYPLSQQAELAGAIATCDGLDVVTSLHGHDGFLVESDQVNALAGKLLA